MADNTLFTPRLAQIVRREQFTPKETFYEFRFKDGGELGNYKVWEVNDEEDLEIDVTIQNNGNDREGYGIKIDGITHDLVIRDNLIQDDRPPEARKQRFGIYVGAQASNIALEGNRFHGHTEQDLFWEQA